MSNSNRVQLSYNVESSWGTPSGTDYQILRYTGESINANLETITSQEIRADRNVADLIQTARSNAGGFEFELSYGTFDDLMEGALFSTWNANVLKNGTTRKSFAIEKAMLDEGEYFLYKGMIVSDFSVNLATSAICTGSFNFMGGAATLGQTSNTASAYTAATTTEVMNCMANVASMMEGSSLTALTGIYVQSLNFTVANNLRPIGAIGYDTAQDIAYGKCDITGGLSVYFTSDRLYDTFLSGALTGLSFTVQKGAQSYTFLFPKVKFESNSVVSGGQDQDVIENLTWRALYDSGIGGMMQITRVAA